VRVQQPPKIRETFAAFSFNKSKGKKIDLSEKSARGILNTTRHGPLKE
jgi:hypothetical protein